MKPPRPAQLTAQLSIGDLWILPRLGDVPEQWLVVELGPEARWVPADWDPRVGSGDVAVPPSSRCGALTLRGRHAARIPPVYLEDGSKIGELEAEYVDQIRLRLTELDGSGPAGSLLERDMDHDPGYRQLDDRLRSVVSRLAAPEPSLSTEHRPTPFRKSNPHRSVFRDAGRAAAALLLLTVGFLAGRLLPGPEPARLRPTPLFALNVDSSLRGEHESLVRIDPRAERYPVVLTLPLDVDRGAYRIDVLSNGAPVHSEPWMAEGSPQIQLWFSRRVFPPGNSYVIELWASQDAAAPVARYSFKVAEEAERH